MAKSLEVNEEQFKRRPQQRPVIKPRQITGVQGVRGTLPLQPGELILTDKERAKLSKFGWKDGDPLPGNIAEMVAKEQQLVADDIRKTRPPQDHPVLKVPEPIDIDKLTDKQYQSSLRADLQKFKTLAPQIESALREQAEFSTLPPAIQKAIKESGGVEVIDSRDPVEEMQQKIDEAEGRAPRATEDRFAPEDDEEEAVVTPVAHCPRCDWTVGDVSPATQDDKLAYVAAILGDQLFVKQYDMYGGRLGLVFQQLSTQEADLAQRQVQHEMRTGQLTEAYGQIMKYRMIMSLKRLFTADKKYDLNVADNVNEFVQESAGPDNSLYVEDRPVGIGDLKWYDALPLAYSRLQEVPPLSTESIWRTCYSTFEKFNHLIDDLDARAASPDFWNAIES